MGRTCDIIGLTPEAESWLKENCILTENGHLFQEHTNRKLITGWMDEIDYPYPVYTTVDGRKVEEFEQHEIWHSGPNHYLALRYVDTQELVEESLWKNEDVGLA